MYQRVLAASLIALLSPGVAYAHGDSHAMKPERKPVAAAGEETMFGRPGDPRAVTRTVKVGMTDKMHFTSGHIHVRQGDTLEFVVTNQGKLMHEMVIGTMSELKQHAEVMRKHPGMEHGEPYMAHVSPGKTESFVWQFSKAGDFLYACLLPGHLEAGMIERISVTQRK